MNATLTLCNFCYFIPTTFFQSTISWLLISQWKTWPCGDHNGYDKEICGNCGIFNELKVKPNAFTFEFRAASRTATMSPRPWRRASGSRSSRW